MYCCLVFMSNTHTHPHTRHMWEAKMTAGCAVLSVFSSCSLLRNGTKEHTIHIPYLAKHSLTFAPLRKRLLLQVGSTSRLPALLLALPLALLLALPLALLQALPLALLLALPQALPLALPLAHPWPRLLA